MLGVFDSNILTLLSDPLWTCCQINNDEDIFQVNFTV